MKKICQKCCKVKDESEFKRHKKNQDGLYNTCKKCAYKWNAPAGYSRQRKLREHYGITEADFDRMREEQGDKCAICKLRSVHRLHVDHCHTTGSIRGLLCRDCNHGLGNFRDNVEWLASAIQYLSR